MPAASTLSRRFFRLTFLNILSNVAVPLAGLVDTAMLGHLPDIRFLAGVALAGVIFDFLYWSFGFLRMGTTGWTAQAVGRGDERDVQLVFQRSLFLGLGCAAALVAFQGPLADLFFHLLAGEPAVEAAGRDYYDARIWGAPATLTNLVLMGWFLGREESRLALAMTFTVSVANIALNYVFILRMGLAAQGAGLATMLAQYLALGLGLVLYWRRQGWPWRLREIVDRSELARLLSLNADIFVRTLCLVAAFSLFTNLSALLGTAILTANALLLRIFTLVAFLIDGAAFSTESLAGILHGSGKSGELRRLLALAMAFGLACSAVAAALLVLAPRPLLGVLTSHADVVELAVAYRGWFALSLPIGAVAFILDGYFIGLTAGRTLRIAMLVSLLVFFLPTAGLAYAMESPTVLWLSFVSFMAGRAVTLGWAAWMTDFQVRVE